MDNKETEAKKEAAKAPETEKKPDGPAPATPPQADQPARKSLEQLVSESNNEEIKALKKEIDEIKKGRMAIIIKLKELRHRLGYKEAELVAIEKLLTIEKQNDDPNARSKRIGYLKHLKNRLEFKISTEVSSQASERDLVRKINEVSLELNEALKLVRLQRKVEYIKGDITKYEGELGGLNKQIDEVDVKLDDKYRSLRKMLGIGHEKHLQKKRPIQPPSMPEINLEDIAVIKKKGAK
jgi:uncharacterized coiled-coil DUF342 family protein